MMRALMLKVREASISAFAARMDHSPPYIHRVLASVIKVGMQIAYIPNI